MTSQISFHPVFCSSPICLLRNSWCQFQILNSLRWMNLLDEMLFLTPLHVFQPFLWTERITHLEGKAQGPEGQLVKTAMLWVQLLTESDRAKDWIWSEPLQCGGRDCSLLTICNPLSERMEKDWELEEIREVLFSHLLSTSYLDLSPVISHNVIIMTTNTAVVMNFLCSLLGSPQSVLKVKACWQWGFRPGACINACAYLIHVAYELPLSSW